MKKKNNLKTKIMLALLAGGMLYAGTAAAAWNMNLVAKTGATGNIYCTDGTVNKTVYSQATKDGDITLGQTINFGNYAQSKATGSTFNTENVNWIVVENKGSGKYTLVSTKVLDKYMDSGCTATVYKWSEGDMRTWMNNTMLNTMFTAKEQGLLIEKSIVTYGHSGFKDAGWDNDTITDESKGYNTSTDKLWVMSVHELRQWFKDGNDTDPTGDNGYSGYDRTGKYLWGAGATDFAVNNGAAVMGSMTVIDGSNASQYWLRNAIDPDIANGKIRFLNRMGAVNYAGFVAGDIGVRPAIEVDFSSYKILFTSVGGKRNTDGSVTIVGKYLGAGTYSGTEFTKAGCSQAAKFVETMTDTSNLDLTFYDANVKHDSLVANTTLELGENRMFKLGYSGANTDYDIAGMIATGDSTSGYTPVGWGKMALSGSTSGTMGIGFDNIDAGTYSLHIMGEDGTGTSFVGDVKIIYDGLTRTSTGLELDLTTGTNSGKSFSGAISIAAGNKLTAKAGQLTGSAASTNNGTIVLKDGGTINFALNETADGGNLILDLGSATNKTLNFAGSALANTVLIKNGSTMNIGAGVVGDKIYMEDSSSLVLTNGTLSYDILKAVSGTAGATANATSGGTVTIKQGTNDANRNVVAANADIKIAKVAVENYATLYMDADRFGLFTNLTIADNGMIGVTANGTDEDGSDTDTLKKVLTNGTVLFSAGNGKTIHTTADNIMGNVNKVESGTLDLTGGTLAKALSKSTTAGTVKVSGTVKATNDITNLDINVVSTGTLGITGGNISGGTLTNAGQIDFSAGTISDAIVNNSTLNLSGNAKIASTDFTNNKTFNVNGGTVGAIKNTDSAGIINVNDVAALTGAITNTAGTVNFLSSGSLGSAVVVTGGNINVGSSTVTGVTLQTSAANLMGDTNTVYASNTLELNSGALSKDVTNNGTVKFNGASAMDASVTGGVLEFSSGTVAVSDGAYIAGNTNTVAGGAMVKITGGALNKNITNSGTVKAESGVVLNSSVITGGDVELGADIKFKNSNLASTVNLVSNGAIYDITLTASASPSVDQISVSTSAKGTLKIGAVAVTGGTTAWSVGETKQVPFLSNAGAAANTITVNNSVSVTSDGYKYNVRQAYNTPGNSGSGNKIGYLEIYKDNGYILQQIVTNYVDTDAGNYEVGNVETYTLVADYALNTDTANGKYTAVSDLGTLAAIGGATDRTLNITGLNTGGTNYKFAGAGGKGIVLDGSGDTLNIGDISEISGWNSYVVDNQAGTVNFSTTGANVMKLGSVAKGAGTYNNNGILQVDDAANLAMTNGITNNNVMKLGSTTSSTLGAEISGGSVDITGKVSTAADNINGVNTLTVATAGALTVSSGDLAKDIANSGSVEIAGGATIGSSKITGGNVTLGSGVEFSKDNLANIVNFTGDGAVYNFNADFSGITPSVDQITLTGTASGSIMLGSPIAVTGSNDAWALGVTKQIKYINGGSGHTISISGTQTATSDGYLYSFANGNSGGYMAVTKSISAPLWQIVQNDNGSGGNLTESNPINTYSLNGDYTETHDLGNLTEVPNGTPREFTIEGNGNKFLGDSHQGITVGGGDTLNLNNISEIANWAPSAVTNNGGTLNINASGGTTALNSKIDGTGTFNNGSGSCLNVADASNLSMGTAGINNSGTINLTEGTLGGKINGGTMNVSGGTVTSNADYICGNNNNVAADGKLILVPGTLNKEITNNGTVELAGVDALNAPITGGTVDINQNLTTSANNIKGDKNVVESGKTLELNGGSLTKKVEGDGNLTINSNMTLNADNIATTGTNKIGSGKTVTLDGGTLGVDFDGEGDSTLVISGEVTSNGNRTIQTGIIFKTGSTFKVNASDVSGDTAAVSGFISALVQPGAKLYVDGATEGQPYKILSGNNNIDLQGWTTDADMGSNFRARFGLKVDVANTTALGSGLSEFVIQFVKDEIAVSGCDIPNIIANLPATGKFTDWVNSISAAYDDSSTQGDLVNTIASMGSLANIQHGTWEMNNLAMDEVFDYMNTDTRPMARYDRSVMQNTAYRQNPYTADNDFQAEPVKIGKVKRVQPARVNKTEKLHSNYTVASNEKYAKDVWATYIHSKETIDGLKTGSLKQNSTLKYDGATVGADLWSNRNGFGGIAITYADGNNTSSHNISSIHNDIDYYGVNIYNRTDTGIFSLQYDIGYTQSKNDIKMSAAGMEDVTADADVHAYSAGLRVETPVVLSETVHLIPFVSGRFVHVETDNYKNSVGLHYKADDADIFTVPLGIALRTRFASSDGWKFGILAEGGIKFNFGDKNSKQGVSYENIRDGVDYDVADKRHWFGKFGLQAANDTCSFEIGYRYSKSSDIKDYKYYANVNFEF